MVVTFISQRCSCCLYVDSQRTAESEKEIHIYILFSKLAVTNEAVKAPAIQLVHIVRLTLEEVSLRSVISSPTHMKHLITHTHTHPHTVIPVGKVLEGWTCIHYL